MKEIIGRVTMYQASKTNSVRVYFAKNLHLQIGEEIVFNEKKMTIKLPTIDAKKVWIIRSKGFMFTPILNETKHYVGEYVVIKKDEDTYKLKKIKDEKSCDS